MNTTTQIWHLDVIALFQNKLYETLLYKHHLITDTVKEFTLIDDTEQEHIVNGYLAVKDTGHGRTKYFVPEEYISHLPVRVNDTNQYYLAEGKKTRSVIEVIDDATPFKIIPDKTFDSVKQFIDTIAPFEHSEPDNWTLNKILAVSSLISKIFIGISSDPEFGKSSIYELLNGITKRCPVFQPRSIPGILAQITGNGNMVFDEVHKSTSEVKQCMENFTLQVAGGKPVYINGALQAKNTKSRYDVSGQSITYLYNTYQNYRNPREEFFDFIFSNNDAIDSRLVKLRLTGVLTEKFDKDFDMLSCAEDNKMLYVNIAKYLLWLKEQRQSNQYTRRWVSKDLMKLNGRKKQIIDEITWLIDWYSDSQDEYDKFIYLLYQSMINYQKMLGNHVPDIENTGSNTVLVSEEVISGLSWDERSIIWGACTDCGDSPCNEGNDGKLYCKKHLR